MANQKTKRFRKATDRELFSVTIALSIVYAIALSILVPQMIQANDISQNGTRINTSIQNIRYDTGNPFTVRLVVMDEGKRLEIEALKQGGGRRPSVYQINDPITILKSPDGSHVQTLSSVNSLLNGGLILVISAILPLILIVMSFLRVRANERQSWIPK